MSNLVEYVLGIRDQMTPAIDNASSHVKQMENALTGVKSIALQVGEAMGIAFAAYKVIAFVKEGREAYETLEQATAKVEANLDSTGAKAGVSMKAVQDYAKELSSGIQASRSEVLDMASQLLTFPSITKDIFQSSMSMVADIAKQTGHDLSETGIMYGKALNDPIDGLQKMQRYGVMFSDAEKEKIKNLQLSGHLIQAQKAMMESIAGSGYAGVAERMFDAEPLARFNKIIASAKLQVGGLVTELMSALAPTFEFIGNTMKGLIGVISDFIGWIKRNKQILGDMLIVISSVTAALGIMAVVTNWTAIVYWGFGVALNAVTIATGIATAATWLFSAALWSTGIPEIILGVAALTAGIIALTHHFGGFANMLSGVWEIIKAFTVGVGEAFWGLGEIIAGAMTFSPKLIAKGLTDTVNSVKEAGKDISDAWNNSDAQAAAKVHKSLVPGKEGKLGAAGANGPVTPAPKTKAEGQKTINIHIAYNAPLLSGGLNVTTVNMKEGLSELKEKVTAILTGATHDSLIVADY